MILATIALVLFLFLICHIIYRDLTDRMIDLDVEIERVKVEYLQQTIDWAIDKQNVYGKETIADSLMDALRGTNYTTWKYGKPKVQLNGTK